MFWLVVLFLCLQGTAAGCGEYGSANPDDWYEGKYNYGDGYDERARNLAGLNGYDMYYYYYGMYGSGYWYEGKYDYGGYNEYYSNECDTAASGDSTAAFILMPGDEETGGYGFCVCDDPHDADWNVPCMNECSTTETDMFCIKSTSDTSSSSCRDTCFQNSACVAFQFGPEDDTQAKQGCWLLRDRPDSGDGICDGAMCAPGAAYLAYGQECWETTAWIFGNAHGVDNCHDYESWNDKTGSTCSNYDENWVATEWARGNMDALMLQCEHSLDLQDTWVVDARVACCICGGGKLNRLGWFGHIVRNTNLDHVFGAELGNWLMLVVEWSKDYNAQQFYHLFHDVFVSYQKSSRKLQL